MMQGSDELPSPAAPSIGAGRYALVAKIAEGGMAGVYRAWDAEVHVWRAIKVLLPEYAHRKSVRGRFEREAATMALLEHPHVVRVYDVVSDEALPFMVMELAEGGNLMEWLEAYGSMPAGLACRVVSEVARGLGAAHAVGVVHRDVKPHNVLISREGLCKVTDFGIARVRHEGAEEGMTRTGSTMGTIGYMSPEQRADAKYVDERADIYSLGALLYKLVTGTIVTDLFLVEHEPALLEKVPDPLHEVIIRSCFHDRDRRYATTQAFTEILSEVRPLLEPDPADTPPLQLPMRQEPLDDTPAGPFPEIAELLQPGQDLADAEPAAERSPPTPAAPAQDRQAVPLPLPQQADASNQPVPADDAAEAPQALAAQLEAPEAVGPGGPPAARLEEPADRGALPTGPATKWLAAAALAAWLMLLFLGVGGAWMVTSAAHADLAAKQQLYEVLQQEQAVMIDLRRAGVPSARCREVEDAYTAFEDARQEPARWRAAVRYVQLVQPLADDVFGASGDREPGLPAARWKRITHAFGRWREARQRWVRTVASGPGRLAAGLGVAPLPGAAGE